jgi:DNA invertase Pin-like site-specific DNA recombinase
VKTAAYLRVSTDAQARARNRSQARQRPAIRRPEVHFHFYEVSAENGAGGGLSAGSWKRYNRGSYCCCPGTREGAQ